MSILMFASIYVSCGIVCNGLFLYLKAQPRGCSLLEYQIEEKKKGDEEILARLGIEQVGEKPWYFYLFSVVFWNTILWPIQLLSVLVLLR